MNKHVMKYSWVGMLVTVLFLVENMYSYYNVGEIFGTYFGMTYIDWSSFMEMTTNIELLGQLIYTIYSPLFMLASMVLFVAMIGL